jgi:HSP20 family molecular chaperone IbpA
MSLSIHRHDRFPRVFSWNPSIFNWSPWHGPSLDIFDPFDEFDRTADAHFKWLSRPSFFNSRPLRMPEKYRVTLDCSGYDPKSVKTELSQNKVVVTAREEHKDDNGDFSTREFRKTYALPENAESEKLVVFQKQNGSLVIEVPLKNETSISDESDEDLVPSIVEADDGKKQMRMKCSLPQGIDPAKVSVIYKNGELIIKAEDNREEPESISKMYYYKQCTLPDNTDFNSLKCRWEDNKLYVEAPVQSSLQMSRQIPIQYNK